MHVLLLLEINQQQERVTTAEFLVRVHEHVVDFKSSRLEGDSFEWFSFSIFFQLRTHRMYNNNAPMQIFAFGKTCKQVANGG